MEKSRFYKPSFRDLKGIQFLFDSEQRLQILCEIYNGANTSRLLREKTELSKSTLNRCLDQLMKKSLIGVDGETYFITDYGSILLEEIAIFTERFSSLSASKEILGVNHFSRIPKRLLMKIEMLKEMETTSTSKFEPYIFSNMYVKLFEKAKTVRAILPTLPIEPDRFIQSSLIGTKVDLVVTSEVFNIINDDLEKRIQPEDFKISIVDGKLHFMLGLFDENLILCLFNKEKEGGITILKSRNQDSLKWGEELFEHYKNKSIPFTSKLNGKLV